MTNPSLLIAGLLQSIPERYRRFISYTVALAWVAVAILTGFEISIHDGWLTALGIVSGYLGVQSGVNVGAEPEYYEGD